MSQSDRLLQLTPALFALLLCATALAGEDSKPLDYPKDLRIFRAKALRNDGSFAPDIAFAVRICPSCKKPYVFGNFPRLKRQPWENLAQVHETIESNVVRKVPPKIMFSPKFGKYVPRMCPLCDAPEEGARPDKILFCHIIPETGEDMQIEYEVNNRSLGAKKYWRVPAEKIEPGALLRVDQPIPDPTDRAVKVDLTDESEESIKKAYGAYFSLRAVWNGIFGSEMQSEKVTLRDVAPGMFFIFKPQRVGKNDFQKFAEETLSEMRDKGAFTRLESPLMIKDVPPDVTTYKQWARKYDSMLGSEKDDGSGAECFVALSYPAMHKAAEQVLATRGVGLEVAGVKRPSDAGFGILKKGDYRYQFNFAPLALETVLRGMSLHEGCALLLTMPAYTLDSAGRLDAALRKRRPNCSFDIREGRFLALRDSRDETRVVDIVSLCDRLDPDDRFQFDLFCDMMLAWDYEKKVFGPRPNPRDVSPTGLPAFMERRVRPVGYLQSKGHLSALYEPREDSEHVRYDLCYTSECAATLVYVDPAKERFKDMTLEQARKVYDSLGCSLPMNIEFTDVLNLPGETVKLPDGKSANLPPCRVVLCGGIDLASLGAEDARASALAQTVNLQQTDRIHLYAFTTNTVAITNRPLTKDEQELAKSRMKDMVTQHDFDAGLELNLHFDLLRGEPRGKVLRRNR